MKYIYILSHLIQKYDYEFNILSDSSWLGETWISYHTTERVTRKHWSPIRGLLWFWIRILSHLEDSVQGTHQAFFHFLRARKFSEGGEQVYESANISVQIVHSKRNCNGSADPMITLDRTFIQILGPNFGFWLLGEKVLTGLRDSCHSQSIRESMPSKFSSYQGVF